MLVGVDDDRLLLSLYRDGDDLVLEAPGLDCGLGLLLRSGGESIL